MGCAQLFGDGHAFGDRIDADNRGRAFKACTGHRAEPDRPQREHRDGIADFHPASLGPGKAGGHDVRAHQHLFVAEAVRYRAQIGQRIRHQYVFSLATIDDIAELPATGGPKAMPGIRAIL
ncbi:hypothetical protein D3C80_1521110 [compost metagenome]